MEVIFMCNGKVVNKQYTIGVRRLENPFDEIPITGDYVELGGRVDELTGMPLTLRKKYIVRSRTFSATEDCNNTYSNSQCTVQLEEVVENNVEYMVVYIGEPWDLLCHVATDNDSTDGLLEPGTNYPVILVQNTPYVCTLGGLIVDPVDSDFVRMNFRCL